MKIIIVTGMPGAGKEEFLSRADSMEVTYARMGDTVREAYLLSAERDDLSVGQFANAERERHGKNIWAKRTIDKMTGSLFLVDGCRSMAEVRSFRELSPDVMIIGIHSPPVMRYERLVKRGREDAPQSLEEFNERDAREISWGLGEVIAMSDIMILNISNLSDFRSASEKVLRELI
jgi:dephospho-CoA kinase